MPPDWPKPRESQVSTLKPALRSGAAPTLPIASLVVPVPSASRLPPQPWVIRIVGAFAPGASPSAGWKEVDDRRAVGGGDDRVAGGGGGGEGECGGGRGREAEQRANGGVHHTPPYPADPKSYPNAP